MGKFGHKNEVSLNPLSYNITLLGESGIGKSTLAKEVCEKLVGDEGYLHLDIGREAGADAIQGIVTEKIENWAKLAEVMDDIIENKATDYPNLKVVIWDTLDELINLAEAETIRRWNKQNPDKKADTINATFGGFMKGQDYAGDLILNYIGDLYNVGVSSLIIGHIKRSDITDPITQETYSKLTADTTQRYFNAIKNKQHFVAVAYIDRDIVKEKTGKKNPVTHQDITRNKAVSESRVISFRDDSYSVDSKCRFADIVDCIPFDSDEFIKAIEDAILAEQAKGSKSLTEAKKEQEVKEQEREKKAKQFSEEVKAKKAVAEIEEHRDEFIDNIKDKFKAADPEIQTEIKEMLATTGCKKFSDPDIPIDILQKMSNMLI